MSLLVLPPDLEELRNSRMFPDPPHDGDRRTAAQRDRDRILYSSAFRRLGGVTQVVGSAELELFHNRLTHSLKVAQVGRRLAERLITSGYDEQLGAQGGVDPDVVEAACLAHDMGHPPFGHHGEEELQDRLSKFTRDTYEGNAQTFRIVTKLAVRQQKQLGLNLTRATRRAILKYPWLYSESKKKWGAYFSEQAEFDDAMKLGQEGLKSPEAALMDIADDITYAVHDVQDFARAGLIPLDRLASVPGEAERFIEHLEDKLPKVPDSQRTGAFEELTKRYFPKSPYYGRRADRLAIHDFASDLISRFTSAVKVGADGVQVEGQERIEIDILMELTSLYVIDDPSIATLRRGQRRLVRELFQELMEWVNKVWDEPGDLNQLPVPLRDRVLSVQSDIEGSTLAGGKKDMLQARAVADYISMLTEAQAVNLHQRLMGISSGAAFENWVRR